MWGEFEDEQKDTRNNSTSRPSRVVKKPEQCKEEQNNSLSQQIEQNTSQCSAEAAEQDTSSSEPQCSSNTKDDKDSEDTMSLPLRDRLLHHLAASNVTVKSQQRYEPDLTYEQRRDILNKLLTEKPGQFLYRFGKYIRGDELQYFVSYAGDPEVDHYLALAQQYHNPHTARIRVRNRRYAAMQRLRKEGDYFSEKEMERRHPLLYDQLIGCHQTEMEYNDRHSSIDRSDLRFSTILLEHIDLQEHKNYRKREEEQEDDMLEEEDDDDDEDEDVELGEEEEEEDDDRRRDGEKRLFREEFYSANYNDFLTGGHKDFDYERVDLSDEYDLTEIQARDAEESYFDQDSDDSPNYTPVQNKMEEDPDIESAMRALIDAEDNVSKKTDDKLETNKYDKCGEGTKCGLEDAVDRRLNVSTENGDKNNTTNTDQVTLTENEDKNKKDAVNSEEAMDVT